jgi:hypothetical protein
MTKNRALHVLCPRRLHKQPGVREGDEQDQTCVDYRDTGSALLACLLDLVRSLSFLNDFEDTAG